MKTHVIKPDGSQTTIEGKIADLKKMQELVDGPIQLVPVTIPKQSHLVDGSENMKEIWVNEEGLLRGDFSINDIASSIIHNAYIDEFGCEGPVIKGPVFITDGWRVE